MTGKWHKAHLKTYTETNDYEIKNKLYPYLIYDSVPYEYRS